MAAGSQADAERSNKKVREFTQTYGMEWPQVLDSSRRYARQFQVTSYPTYLVVDHTGRIVYTHSGASKSVEAKITSAVKKAVREAEESLD